MRVAKAGERAEPSLPAPAALRRYLDFTKLPPPVFVAVKRAADTDPEFRARVAAAAPAPNDVGISGWLWLHRPDGWEAAAAAIRTGADAGSLQSELEQKHRTIERRAAQAEQQVAEAREHSAQLMSEIVDLKRALADARRERRDADLRAGEFEAQLTDLEDGRAEAVRQLKAVEAHHAQRLEELRQAQERNNGLEHQLHEAVEHVRSLTSEASAARQRADGQTNQRQSKEGETADSQVTETALTATTLDVGLIAGAIEGASRAAADLAAALATAAEALDRPTPIESESSGETPRQRARARRPARLPVGLFEDSREAADHLVRLPRCVLLVDGYNITKEAWPGLSIADQRQRLVDALCALAARTGVSPDVVFDGVDDGGVRIGRTGQGVVRVRFTPGDVEADDVVIELVSDHSIDDPVVVVSSDRRVRDGSAARGANLLYSRQLIALL